MQVRCCVKDLVKLKWHRHVFDSADIKGDVLGTKCR